MSKLEELVDSVLDEVSDHAVKKASEVSEGKATKGSDDLVVSWPLVTPNDSVDVLMKNTAYYEWMCRNVVLFLDEYSQKGLSNKQHRHFVDEWIPDTVQEDLQYMQFIVDMYFQGKLTWYRAYVNHGSQKYELIQSFPEDALTKDSFDFTKRLGNGAFGVVWSVVSRDTKEVLACKCVNLKGMKKQTKHLMMEEVGVLARLDHKYIINYRASFHDEETLYVITEFLGGGDLSDKLKHPKHPEKACAISEKYTHIIIYQVLDALSYCHRKGLVHADIKPQNVMFVDRKGIIVKLIDFGLCREQHLGMYMKRKAGTPFYMAPEIFTGNYTESVDVWAVGVMTYQLLHGYLPFQAKSMDELKLNVARGLELSQSGKGQWVRKNRISERAKQFIEDCLRVDQNKRPSTYELKCYGWFEDVESLKDGLEPIFVQAFSRNLTTEQKIIGSIFWNEGQVNVSIVSELRIIITEMNPEGKKKISLKDYVKFMVEKTPYSKDQMILKVKSMRKTILTFEYFAASLAYCLFKECTARHAQLWCDETEHIVTKARFYQLTKRNCKSMVSKQDCMRVINELFAKNEVLDYRKFVTHVCKEDDKRKQRESINLTEVMSVVASGTTLTRSQGGTRKRKKKKSDGSEFMSKLKGTLGMFGF